MSSEQVQRKRKEERGKRKCVTWAAFFALPSPALPSPGFYQLRTTGM